MSILGSQTLIDHSPEDRPDHGIAWTKPASEQAVADIIAADPNLPDGFTRSEWLWVRLANGDLILGVFPQDDAYFTWEDEHS